MIIQQRIGTVSIGNQGQHEAFRVVLASAVSKAQVITLANGGINGLVDAKWAIHVRVGIQLGKLAAVISVHAVEATLPDFNVAAGPASDLVRCKKLPGARSHVGVFEAAILDQVSGCRSGECEACGKDAQCGDTVDNAHVAFP